MENQRIGWIKKEIKPLRKTLTEHRLYEALSGIDDIRIFMEKHVFAVWDFMSLLKSLQTGLTCTNVPWKPAAHPKTISLINEIVLREESDINRNEEPRSHYEMYLDAMEEVGANTSKVIEFVNHIQSLSNIHHALDWANLGREESDFMMFTFGVIGRNQLHQTAAAFTFGRVALIPDMFAEILKQTGKTQGKSFPKLSDYLQRHLDVDSTEHDTLSLELVNELCGDDDEKWEEVLIVAKAALQARLNLWDDITDLILENAMMVKV